MTEKSNYLTRKGYDKLFKDLQNLKSGRKNLSKAIEIARGHGDLSENAEYDAAKEAQAFNEKRIAELEEKLSGAMILDDENISKDEALLGATVTLKDIDTGQKIEYTLVSEAESDYEQGRISVASPIGRGILGHKKGDKVEIEVPAGVLKYKIVKISR